MLRAFAEWKGDSDIQVQERFLEFRIRVSKNYRGVLGLAKRFSQRKNGFIFFVRVILIQNFGRLPKLHVEPRGP